MCHYRFQLHLFLRNESVDKEDAIFDYRSQLARYRIVRVWPETKKHYNDRSAESTERGRTNISNKHSTNIIQ